MNTPCRAKKGKFADYAYTRYIKTEQDKDQCRQSETKRTPPVHSRVSQRSEQQSDSDPRHDTDVQDADEIRVVHIRAGEVAVDVEPAGGRARRS